MLHKSIVAGRFDVSGNRLVVGQDFARSLNLSVGDRLVIYSIPDLKRMRESWKKRGDQSEIDEVRNPDEYEIRGIFALGYFEYDYRVIVCSLGNAQDLYGLGNAVE